MNLKIKRLHPDAVLPSFAKDGDSGLDLHALEDVVLLAGVPTLVRTGIAVELPLPGPWYLLSEGFQRLITIPVTFEAQIRPRSGLALKHGITCHFGTVDNGYRGEIGVVMMWSGHNANSYQIVMNDFSEQRHVLKSEYYEQYRDTWHLASGEFYLIRKGDRIAQMVVAPVVRCNVVEPELSESERGAGGFGSTGK